MKYYDYISKGYGELHKEEQLNKLRIIKENISVVKDDKLLDVGCGPGYSAEIFECNITGVDPSAELLKDCDFPTVEGVAEDMPFRDGEFDIVISVTAVHNFEDYEKGISEMKRVGRGTFAFSILKKAQKFNETISFIEDKFEVLKEIEEAHDLIIIAQKRNI